VSLLSGRGGSEGAETAEQTGARADVFRTLMADRGDSTTTLLVSHWAFILALTGISLANGEILEYEPTSSAGR
jgi:broad specificity phosphatase PhoE